MITTSITNMNNLAVFNHGTVNAACKPRFILAMLLQQLIVKLKRWLPDLIAWSAACVLLVVCHGVRANDVKYHFHQADPTTILTEFVDDNGNPNSNVLRKYKVYKPKNPLPEYAGYGDGITIWVNDNALPQDNIHLKVKILEANLDAMFERSVLTQKNFLRVSNQARTNNVYGFTLGLIVDIHYASQVGPGSIFDRASIRGLAKPIDYDDVIRDGFSNMARPAKGSASMVVVRPEIFTHYLESDTPLLKPAPAPRYTYAQAIEGRAQSIRPVGPHHQMEIVESDVDGAKIAVAYDPVDGSIANVTTLERLDLETSDRLRTTIYHEASHVYTMSEGRLSPIMRNKQVSKSNFIVEELDTLGYILGSNKGDFTEFHYRSERDALRGRVSPPRDKYAGEFLKGILQRWQEHEPVSYSAWRFSGGEVNSQYVYAILHYQIQLCPNNR